jgi:16S rRNA (cytosine967-C5)-methyltransferase
VLRIPGFTEGKVSVQDPAAQLAADFLAPAKGERILDACAAPGGKTCHLLERQPGIDLLALDRDAARVSLIRENLERLGLQCRVETADASNPDQWWDGTPFDKILLDAPCSTTGVIRRHPDIKWLRDAGQVQNAVSTQQQLLDRLWPLLGAGGILVYSTCSILKSENHKQIHGFLSRHTDAEPAGPDSNANESAPPGRQILPGQEGMDGFYYAVIRKSS